jgi:Tol biopolymer transport system component
LGKAAKFPDWSPDGKYVVFITPADWKSSQSQILVGILARQQVTDENGQILSADRLPARDDLAGFLFNELSRVRVAKDGRIFFSATEIVLPTAVKDVDTQSTIFSFDPGKQSTLTRVVPRSALPTVGDAAPYFELSPDARYVSIPFGDGRVSVLDIASGEAQVVQPEAKREGDNQSQLASVPVWRTVTELSFLRPVPNSTAHEVVRYSIPEKTATVISSDWPAGVGLGGKNTPADAATQN